MGQRTLQGALLFLGFTISVLATIYFAFEYIPKLSEWSQLAALILLGLFFAFLGVYIRSSTIGQPFFEAPSLSWLRPPIVLYLLAVVSGIVAEIRFLGIDDLPRPAKILVSLVVGVGMIVWVAQRRARPTQAAPEETTKPRARRPRRT